MLGGIEESETDALRAEFLERGQNELALAEDAVAMCSRRIHAVRSAVFVWAFSFLIIGTIVNCFLEAMALWSAILMAVLGFCLAVPRLLFRMGAVRLNEDSSRCYRGLVVSVESFVSSLSGSIIVMNYLIRVLSAFDARATQHSCQEQGPDSGYRDMYFYLFLVLFVVNLLVSLVSRWLYGEQTLLLSESNADEVVALSNECVALLLTCLSSDDWVEKIMGSLSIVSCILSLVIRVIAYLHQSRCLAEKASSAIAYCYKHRLKMVADHGLMGFGLSFLLLTLIQELGSVDRNGVLISPSAMFVSWLGCGILFAAFLPCATRSQRLFSKAVERFKNSDWLDADTQRSCCSCCCKN